MTASVPLHPVRGAKPSASTGLTLLGAGAAQSFVGAVAVRFEADAGCTVGGEFGPVGALAAKLRAGAAPDVVIVSAAATAELIREGHLFEGTDTPLGTVHTALAVRGADAMPAIGDAADLKAALLRAGAIFAPDPVKATAGIHFAAVIDRLEIRDAVQARLRTFPNGEGAARALAAAPEPNAIACAQATEIMAMPGIGLVGPLPEGFGLATVYAVAVCARTGHEALARAFASFLTSAARGDERQRAGFA